MTFKERDQLVAIQKQLNKLRLPEAPPTAQELYERQLKKVQGSASTGNVTVTSPPTPEESSSTNQSTDSRTALDTVAEVCKSVSAVATDVTFHCSVTQWDALRADEREAFEKEASDLYQTYEEQHREVQALSDKLWS